MVAVLAGGVWAGCPRRAPPAVRIWGFYGPLWGCLTAPSPGPGAAGRIAPVMVQSEPAPSCHRSPLHQSNPAGGGTFPPTGSAPRAPFFSLSLSWPRLPTSPRALTGWERCPSGFASADWTDRKAARPAHIRASEARRRWGQRRHCGGGARGSGEGGPGPGGDRRGPGGTGRDRRGLLKGPGPRREPVVRLPAGPSPWPPCSRTAGPAPRCPARWRRCPTTCLRRSCRRKVGEGRLRPAERVPARPDAVFWFLSPRSPQMAAAAGQALRREKEIRLRGRAEGGHAPRARPQNHPRPRRHDQQEVPTR